MSGESIGQYPQPKLPDKVQQVAKAAVAAIPLVGGSAAELLDLVITPSVQKHQAIWLNELADVVDTLRDRGVDVAALADDEAFATAVLHASRIALGTHLEGKIRRLKSCLVTMALTTDRDDFIAMRFIGFVDELSDEHFVVMTYARDPIAWFEHHDMERQHYLSASRRQAMTDANVGIGPTEVEIVLHDLSSRRLVDTGSLAGMVTENSVYSPWITDLGSHLLDFVEVF